MRKAKRILMVYCHPDPPDKTRSTILHHLHVLDQTDSQNEVVYYNAFDTVPNYGHVDETARPVPGEISKSSYDAVILHYTFLGFRTIGKYFPKWRSRFRWIEDLPCPKIAIPQDEGDYAGVLDEWLYDLGVSVIFSVHYRPEGRLYPLMRKRATFYSCLPGYIHEPTAERYKDLVFPVDDRLHDIVYRARHLPFWYGTAGRLKGLLADIVGPRARALGLDVDISTKQEDVVFGNSWLDFIASGKAVIGSEGGYSVLDYWGEIKTRVKELLLENPEMTFEEMDARMPPSWDRHSYLTVTPRHFEAVVTRTCQILVRGNYKGVLVPDRHYIPIEPDFSNLDEALEKLRDNKRIQDMVDCAYEEIYLGTDKYTYHHFAECIEGALEKFSIEKSDKQEKVRL